MTQLSTNKTAPVVSMPANCNAWVLACLTIASFEYTKQYAGEQLLAVLL